MLSIFHLSYEWSHEYFHRNWIVTIGKLVINFKYDKITFNQMLIYYYFCVNVNVTFQLHLLLLQLCMSIREATSE